MELTYERDVVERPQSFDAAENLSFVLVFALLCSTWRIRDEEFEANRDQNEHPKVSRVIN